MLCVCAGNACGICGAMSFGTAHGQSVSSTWAIGQCWVRPPMYRCPYHMPLLASHDEHQSAELALNSAVRAKLALPMLRISDRQWARLMITCGYWGGCSNADCAY